MQKLFEALYDKGITILNTDGQYDPSIISGPSDGYGSVTGDYTDESPLIRLDRMDASVNEDVVEFIETSNGFVAKTPNGDQIYCTFGEEEDVIFTKIYKDSTTTTGRFPFAQR